MIETENVGHIPSRMVDYSENVIMIKAHDGNLVRGPDYNYPRIWSIFALNFSEIQLGHGACFDNILVRTPTPGHNLGEVTERRFPKQSPKGFLKYVPDYKRTFCKVHTMWFSMKILMVFWCIFWWVFHVGASAFFVRRSLLDVCVQIRSCPQVQQSCSLLAVARHPKSAGRI